jgi:hypothetical protein
VSSGAATAAGSPDARLAELFRAADAAQYRAKRAGRGCFCVATADELEDTGASRRAFRDHDQPGAGIRAALARVDW